MAAAYGADHQPWCQPGDQTQRAFRLRFEDPDMREMVWTGPDAEKEALAAYNQYAPAWNVYLFSGHPRAAPSADTLREVVEALEVAKRLAMTHAPLSVAPKIIKALAALKAEGAK